MWVVLIASILNREHDHGGFHRLDEALDRIPDGLNDFLHDILTRDSNDIEDSVRCIQWLLFAREQLRPLGLYCAMLIPSDFKNSSVDVSTRSGLDRPGHRDP